MVCKGNVKMGGMEADNPQDRALGSLAVLMKSGGYRLDDAERVFVLNAAKSDGLELRNWLLEGRDPAMEAAPGGHDHSIPYPAESASHGFQHASYRAGGWEQEGAPGGAPRRGDEARAAEVRSGPQFGSNGADAEAMGRHYSDPTRQLPGVAAYDSLSAMLSEVARSVKSMNAAFRALLAKAEEHNLEEDESEEEQAEEQRARAMRPASESRDDEDDSNQHRWPDGRRGKSVLDANVAAVEAALAGRAMLVGSIGSIGAAMAGQGVGSLPQQALFKADWLAAKAQAVEGAALSLSEELEASGILMSAQACAAGAISPAQFRMRLSTASEPVKRIFGE